jgi:hypothetical protein
MRNVLTVVVLAGVVAQLAAQGPIVPPPKSPPVKGQLRDAEMSLTIEGCIRGRVLKPDMDSPTNRVTLDLIHASQFDLEGTKELLGQLKQFHNDHQDEITGIAVIPSSEPVDGEVKSKQIGKRTRITGGAGSTGGNEPRTFRSIKLKVTSLKHLADKCSIPGA